MSCTHTVNLIIILTNKRIYEIICKIIRHPVINLTGMHNHQHTIWPLGSHTDAVARTFTQAILCLMSTTENLTIIHRKLNIK
jgi:hypothetical protein